MNIGKVSDEFFRRNIAGKLGAPAADLVVGPAMGVDAAVIKVGEQYMVVAEDPIFPVPGLPLRDFGWFTVHIGASDVAVLGVKPRYMTYSLLVPPATPEDDLAEIISSISETAAEEGITIVGGHTGYYPAVTVPTIGGVTVWGFGDEVVTPAGAQVGDEVIITKGAAIEAAGLLAQVYGDDMLAAGIDPEIVREAAAMVYEMSVIREALLAVEVGGVHAMHDATEGGVLRGLHEVAVASRVGLRIDAEAIFVPPAAKVTCQHFGIDPLVSISEGTMVMTCSPSVTGEMMRAFDRAGIRAAVVGEVVPEAAGRKLLRDGREEELTVPDRDPFWEVFFRDLLAREGA